MSSAYWLPFVFFPEIIKEPGTYLTRCGERVTIEKVSTRHDYGCRGQYSTGETEGWHKSGRIFPARETKNDIVALAPN